MADSTIGSLPAIQTMQTADLFVLEQNGVAKRMSGAQLSSFIDRQVVSISVIERAATESYTASYNSETGALVLGIPRGVGIASISDPVVSGLNRTYTMTFEKPASASEATTKQFTLYDGNGIASITQTGGSSSHPAGTVDTYTITFTNGTTTTFQVRNGEDGEGAPGSATPLAAAGEARVGTSTSFARQDHRHPVTEKKYDLTIPSGSWTQVSGKNAWEKNIFSQISAAGITLNAYTKLDLYAEADTLLQMIDDGVSTIYPVVTYYNGSYIPYLYAIGAAPTTAFDVQIIASEVRT